MHLSGYLCVSNSLTVLLKFLLCWMIEIGESFPLGNISNGFECFSCFSRGLYFSASLILLVSQFVYSAAKVSQT